MNYLRLLLFSLCCWHRCNSLQQDPSVVTENVCRIVTAMQDWIAHPAPSTARVRIRIGASDDDHTLTMTMGITTTMTTAITTAMTMATQPRNSTKTSPRYFCVISGLVLFPK